MKKIIVLGNMQVEKDSCTVAFNVRVGFQGRNKCISMTDLSADAVGVTHHTLYDMLENAVEVTDAGLSNNRIAQLDMGNEMYVDVWLRMEAK